MKVRELITQLLDKDIDIDAEIAIEEGDHTIRDYVAIDGISLYHSKFDGVLIVPSRTMRKD